MRGWPPRVLFVVPSMVPVLSIAEKSFPPLIISTRSIFKFRSTGRVLKDPDLVSILNYVEDADAKHTYHAEFLALLRIKNNPHLRDATLIVVRSGNRLSKPCVHCENYILSCGIKRVYYSS